MERQVGFSTEGASVTPFCNLDSVVARPEFGLTLIDQATLMTRLSVEVKFFATQVKNEWPAFKADPFGYAHVRVVEFCSAVAQRLRTPNTSAGAIAAVSIVISVMLCVRCINGCGHLQALPLSAFYPQGYREQRLRFDVQ